MGLTSTRPLVTVQVIRLIVRLIACMNGYFELIQQARVTGYVELFELYVLVGLI